MKTPTLTLIIPTQGRPTLERTLDSVRDQLLPGDEVLVVIDTHEMSLTDRHAIAHRITPYPYQVRVLEYDAGRHDHGHSQINHGMARATGDYLAFNDDDDIFEVGALAVMREAATAHPGRPLLFRFRSHLGGTVFWLQPGLVRQACIGGHCCVFPNDPAHLGKWGDHYEGDFTFLKSSLDSWAAADIAPVWCEPIIAIARPQ